MQKKQLLRLIKLVSELKENRFPNCVSFAERLRRADTEDNIPVSCGVKTIRRDIKLLKEQFNAPIYFDYERNGFGLRHHGWNFQCPYIEEEDLFAAVFGARVAEQMLPSPVNNRIRLATDAKLTTNNPDFL